MSSLYLHIPFCHCKCRYCSFFSQDHGGPALRQRYVQALAKEISTLALDGEPSPLTTLFIGGGTPSVLTVSQLRSVMQAVLHRLVLAEDGEFSIEANPGTLSLDYLKELRGLGFNRLSLGVQSLADRELRALGRIHTSAAAIEAANWARRAGFANLSLDLMTGLPGQTLESWRHTLQEALQLEPSHLSIYQLTVEEGTPLAAMLAEGRLHLPDEEMICQLDELTANLVRAAGLYRYEISNYCQPGYACRHNLNYWQNGEYLAAGAAAVSYRSGIRERRVENVEDYIGFIEQDADLFIEREQLSIEESYRESIIMGLRMVAGVNLSTLQERYGIDVVAYYGRTLERLLARDLLVIDDGYLRIPAHALNWANQIMAELV